MFGGCFFDHRGQHLSGRGEAFLFIQQHSLQQADVDLDAPGDGFAVAVADAVQGFPGADAVASCEVHAHLQAVEQAGHHGEQFRHAAGIPIGLEFLQGLDGAFHLVLGQPAGGLQGFEHRHEQGFVHLPGVHGALGTANPHKGVFQAVLGPADQHPDGHGQQQAQIPGLFGVPATEHQQPIGLGDAALVPEYQHQVQLQAGLADSCRPRQLLHGSIQAGTQQLFGMSKCALAQLNTGVGIHRQSFRAGIPRFPGKP